MTEQDRETMEFLQAREDRLEGKMIYRTYSLYYGSSEGEERQWGVFLYSDGELFIFEDFDRKPSFLGIELKNAKRPKYEKLERSFYRNDVQSVTLVTRSSAAKAIKGEKSAARPSGLFDRIFRKNLTEVALKSGRKYYFELMERDRFESFFK